MPLARGDQNVALPARAIGSQVGRSRSRGVFGSLFGGRR
jgi:hypothetical protein